MNNERIVAFKKYLAKINKERDTRLSKNRAFMLRWANTEFWGGKELLHYRTS